MGLTDELKELLRENGAKLVGIGDMRDVENCDYDFGVAVAVIVPEKIVRDLQTAPTKEYADMYTALNHKLDDIVTAGETFLREKGFDAYAQTKARVRIDDRRISPIPHKTVATRAGLGWIGKNCLLVTEEYGSAVRISSLLTNAPLECDESVDRSHCGTCDLCVRECPAQALHGTLWEAGMKREKIVDVEQCYNKQKEIMLRATGIDTDLCGKCFATCAYTRKYLKKISPEKDRPGLELKEEDDGLVLTDGNMTLRCDFTHMIPRIKQGRLQSELLVRAAKIKGKENNLTAIDATAGFGEDSLLLAAAGFSVILYEYDPVIAALLRDGLKRAADIPELSEAVGRMELCEGDSITALQKMNEPPDVVYLDPMFPERQKSGLIKKKFQLLQQLERPCEDEGALVRAAYDAGPRKIIIKRPLKGAFLADIQPGYSLKGKSIRYDCIVLPKSSGFISCEI